MESDGGRGAPFVFSRNRKQNGFPLVVVVGAIVVKVAVVVNE